VQQVSERGRVRVLRVLLRWTMLLGWPWASFGVSDGFGPMIG